MEMMALHDYVNLFVLYRMFCRLPSDEAVQASTSILKELNSAVLLDIYKNILL